MLGGCNGRLQFVFGAIKRLISWPVQHCLMKALSVNYSEHQSIYLVSLSYGNWHLCPVRSILINDSESNSIFSDYQVQSVLRGFRVGCENEK